MDRPQAWRCIRCGFILLNLEMQQLRFDYGCPRCGESFSNFTLQEAKEEN